MTLPKVPKQSTELDSRWLYETMRDISNQFGPVRVVVEKAQKFSPGVLALCSMWNVYGQLVMCISGVLQLPLVPIPPQQWQKVMLRGMFADTKTNSIARAKQLFPAVCLRKSLRCTTDCDGMSDALLIATYGKNTTL